MPKQVRHDDRYIYLLAFTISIAFLVASVSSAYFLPSITSLLISLLPIPTAQTPALNQPPMFSLVSSTPPVGINNRFGNNSLIPDKNDGPNKLPGNNLITFAPKFSALIISDGVIQPGTQSTLFLLATSITSSTNPGLIT